MRYLILVPPSPVDPRTLKLASTAQLNEALPIVMDCESEQQAVNYVRSRHFDAVAMPMPISLGSGTIVILGLVPDPARAVDPDAEIPCVLFVQCVAQNDSERQRIKKHPAFDRKLWKVPVCKPELAQTHRVDLRATDLEVPTFTEARVGSINGRLTIYVDVGGIEMSLMFEEPHLSLRSEAPRMVMPDVRATEGSDLGDHRLEP